MKKSFEKYFKNYSEKELDLIKDLPKYFSLFDMSLTVPIYDEKNCFDKLIRSSLKAGFLSNKKILHIIVVNNRESSDKSSKETNYQTLNFWRKKLKQDKNYGENKNLFYGLHKEQGFIFIDRSTQGNEFSEKEGVGLARKIACDLACFLFAIGRVKSSHIFTTDGDAYLPEDFYHLPRFSEKSYFMLSNFKHQEEGESKERVKALQKYEKYLQSYVDGLAYAGSPYAFHTVGSCLSFSVEAYIGVRGFPKSRLAGEDFYLLNKIAKTAKHYQHKSKPILLSSRLSTRVPFGTGRALDKILKSEKEKVFQPYEKEAFSYLKTYLCFAQEKIEEKKTRSIKNNFRTFLKKENYFSFIEEAKKKSNDSKKQLSHFHLAFDAFQTQRFIKKIRLSFVNHPLISSSRLKLGRPLGLTEETSMVSSFKKTSL